MHQLLISRLHDYLSENNPDVLVGLQDQGRTSTWLEEKVKGLEIMIAQWRSEAKPSYLIEEMCLAELTAEFRPSRFNYVSAVFEEEFAEAYYSFKEAGVLRYELINLLATCESVFEQTPLTEENEEDRFLRYAVIGTIKIYLDNKI